VIEEVVEIGLLAGLAQHARQQHVSAPALQRAGISFQN